jgi:SAM-dependent methyltransferase
MDRDPADKIYNAFGSRGEMGNHPFIVAQNMNSNRTPQGCRICSNRAGNRMFLCKEKMFGWGNEFAYFQCSNCGCLQIAEVPPDLGKFYPKNYFSFRTPTVPNQGYKARLAGIRDLSTITDRGFVGKLLGRLYPSHDDRMISLGRVPLQLDSNVLDVGCGNGALLLLLHRAGLRRLQGIDPFLSCDLEPVPGLRLQQRNLNEVKGSYDVIIFNHVFEHVRDGLGSLIRCLNHLNPNGKVILRFPTADSEAWEQYRENWVQLDAPRHLFLYSRKSFELISTKAGLKIEQWFCDSSAFQLWASELYKRGIPLLDRQQNPVQARNFFSKEDMEEFDRKAKALNRNGRGDQVTVILKS